MCRELDDYDTRELVEEIIDRGTAYVEDAIEDLLAHRRDLPPHLRRWIQLDLDNYSAKIITQADLDHYLKSIGVSGGSS